MLDVKSDVFSAMEVKAVGEERAGGRGDEGWGRRYRCTLRTLR